MFSVIIPLYNKELSVSNTIQSVLDQSFQDFEIVIVNDGSTDNSVNEVEKFDDKRIRLIHQENQGVSAARNRGIEEAKYDLIAFLDGDDWWSKCFLGTFYELSQNFPDAGLYGGQYVQVNNKNKIIKVDRFPLISEGYFKFHEYLYSICSSSIVIKKHVFKKTGNFDESLTHGEDTDMWVRVALNFKLCYTNKIVAYYNIGGNPLTKSTGKTPLLNRHFLSKIDNYFGRGDEAFDSTLLKRKVSYLKRFYIQYPSDTNVRKLVKSLPDDELKKKKNRILTYPIWIIFTMHFLLISFQSLVKTKNLISLKIKK